MERVAILGGGGMLGTDLVGVCGRGGLEFAVYDLPEFDITKPEHVHQVVKDSDVVVNCAAYTNVDQAELEFDLAYQVNAEAVGVLGETAKEAGKWVLHISTDFVFDGKSDKPYRETDKANPINTYGKSKLAGEKLLAKSGCRHCIVRVEWTYGLAGRNFVTKLLGYGETNKDIRVVDDQSGSPTATVEVADAVCELLRIRPEGVYHFASAGYTSRFEVAKFIFEKVGMAVNLSKCKSSDYESLAARPLNSRFDCGKIQGLLNKPIERWELPLGRFLELL